MAHDFAAQEIRPVAWEFDRDATWPEATIEKACAVLQRAGVGAGSARRDKYVINGSKTFITNGGYADWCTVYAKTDPDAGHQSPRRICSAMRTTASGSR
jgi:alkylation response protein AidB-like acyl-CoA dehydrogenase